MIRVGLDTTPLYGKSEGVKRYIRELSPRLSDAGDVDLQEVGVPVSPSKFLQSVYTARKFGFFARQTNELFYTPLKARRNLDLLHYPDTFGPIRSAVPYVITVHDTTFLTHPDKHEEWVRRWLTRMCELTWPGARQIISVSDTTAEDLVAAGVEENRITVITHGIDHQIFRTNDSVNIPRQRSRGRYIAYLGNIEPRKGLAPLIEGFNATAGQMPPDVQLLIAGKDAWGPAIAGMIGDSERIKTLGRIDEGELTSFLRDATAFVYPSKYEGFGLPPLEALSLGTPVIVGDTPVARETLNDQAVFVDPDSPSSIATALLAAVSTPQTTEQRDERISYAKRFSWSEAAAKTRKVYLEALA